MNERASIYEKISDLQERLRKSEQGRLKLEQQFTYLMRSCREKKEARLTKLRKQYEDFLILDQKRRERNDQILETLNRSEQQIAVLNAKTQRLNILRQHYEKSLQKRYPKLKLRDILKSEMMKIPPENLDFLKYKSQITSPLSRKLESSIKDFRNVEEFNSSNKESPIMHDLQNVQDILRPLNIPDFVDIKSDDSNHIEKEIELEQNTSGDILNITLSEDTNPQIRLKPSPITEDTNTNQEIKSIFPYEQTLNSIKLVNPEVNISTIEKSNSNPKFQTNEILDENISEKIFSTFEDEHTKKHLEKEDVANGSYNNTQHNQQELEPNDQNTLQNNNQNLTYESSTIQQEAILPTAANSPLNSQPEQYQNYITSQQDNQYYEEYNQNKTILENDPNHIENQAYEEYSKIPEYEQHDQYQHANVSESNQEYLNYPQDENIYDPNNSEQVFYQQEDNYENQSQYYEQPQDNLALQDQNFNEHYNQDANMKHYYQENQEQEHSYLNNQEGNTSIYQETNIQEIETNPENYENTVQNNPGNMENYYQETNFQEISTNPENYENTVQNNPGNMENYYQETNFQEISTNPENYENTVQNNPGNMENYYQETNFQEIETNPENYENTVENNQGIYNDNNVSFISPAENQKVNEQEFHNLSDPHHQNIQDNLEQFNENSELESNFDREINEKYIPEINAIQSIDNENLSHLNNKVNDKFEKKPELVTNIDVNYQEDIDTVTESSSDFWDLGGFQKESNINDTAFNQEKEEKINKRDELGNITSNINTPFQSTNINDTSSESSDFPKATSELAAQLSKVNIEISGPPPPKVPEQIDSEPDLKEKELSAQQDDSDFDFSIEQNPSNK